MQINLLMKRLSKMEAYVTKSDPVIVKVLIAYSADSLLVRNPRPRNWNEFGNLHMAKS